MKKIDRIKKLNDLLRHHCGYTFYQLVNKLDVSDRTVRDDLRMIQNPPYNAVLANEYIGKERLYRYKDSTFSIHIFDDRNELQEKVNDALSAIKPFEGTPQYEWLKVCLLGLENGQMYGTQNIMSFDNNAYLEGLSWIEPIVEAITHKYPIKIIYKPYGKSERELHIHPYHLKQYNNRWFLFGRPDNIDAIHNYAIDRIHSVEHLSKEFKDTDIMSMFISNPRILIRRESLVKKNLARLFPFCVC